MPRSSALHGVNPYLKKSLIAQLFIGLETSFLESFKANLFSFNNFMSTFPSRANLRLDKELSL